jgi:GAF domain-containing protein
VLEAFCALGRALAAPIASPTHVGDSVWTHLRPHVPASACVLFVYDRDEDALVPAYRAGETVVAARTRIALGDRLSGWVAATRRPIVNSDARLDLDADVRDETALRCALSVPVGDDAELLGVLAFYARGEAAFDARHQRLAEAAAHAIVAPLRTAARRPTAVAV